MDYSDWIKDNEDYWDISKYKITKLHIVKSIDITDELNSIWK